MQKRPEAAVADKSNSIKSIGGGRGSITMLFFSGFMQSIESLTKVFFFLEATFLSVAMRVANLGTEIWRKIFLLLSWPSGSH